jgi:hypothetical protein
VGHEADASARPAHPRKLRGGLLLVRREHGTEDRADDVEARVLEGQRLGIAVDEGRIDTLGVGARGGPAQRERPGT